MAHDATGGFSLTNSADSASSGGGCEGGRIGADRRTMTGNDLGGRSLVQARVQARVQAQVQAGVQAQVQAGVQGGAGKRLPLRRTASRDVAQLLESAVEQTDDPFESLEAGSPTDAEFPEWVDCDSEYVEALEQSGLQALAEEVGGPWTWHHDYMSNLPDAERAVLVALCERHVCQCLTWQQAASMLHTALGEPPSLDEMYGGYDDADFGCDYEESEYEPEEEWDYYDELDPSDYEIDMGYREDYDEDDTNWEPHDEQDDSEDLDGLSVHGDDEDDSDEPDDYDDES